MNKHSLAPWTVATHTAVSIDEITPGCDWTIYGADNVSVCFEGAYNKHAQANVRLIMAAPELADTIERLENEALAYDIRMENDKQALAEMTASRDAYQQAADKMAAAHKVERDEAYKTSIRLAEDLQYIAGIVEKGRGAKTPDSMKVRAAILGYVQELESERDALAQDAARLVWAMNNMCQHNYTLFGMHVMNVGGTGDVHDCRTFVDNAMKETK